MNIERINKKPVILITGYLGSGKTTLLQKLLENQDNRGLALIVNDMGSVNIDGILLKKEDNAQEGTRMVELQNGCICCTLRDAFMVQIEELSRDERIDKIMVEASGISNPASIAEAFLAAQSESYNLNAYLQSIVTVVDADRIYQEFLEDMEELFEDEELDETEPDVINLVMDQIEFCSTIILNKCDLLPLDKLEAVKRIIRQIQPEAKLIETSWGEVNSGLVFDGTPFDYDKVMNSSSLQKALLREKHMDEAGLENYGISSIVYEERRPFDRDRFMTFLEKAYPENVIRAKGYIWFSDDWNHAQLFEQAGRNASVSEATCWAAALPETDKQEMFQDYPEILNDYDAVYGDRLNQIVLIGKDCDKETMESLLNECLETVGCSFDSVGGKRND